MLLFIHCRDQLRCVGALAAHLSWLSLRARHAAMRPTLPCRGHAALWWRYAAEASTAAQRQQRRAWAWSTLRERRDQRRAYVQCYATVLAAGGAPLADTSTLAQLAELERGLEVVDIVRYRTLALRMAPTPAPSWSWRSLLGAASPQQSDTLATLLKQLTDQDPAAAPAAVVGRLRLSVGVMRLQLGRAYDRDSTPAQAPAVGTVLVAADGVALLLSHSTADTEVDVRVQGCRVGAGLLPPGSLAASEQPGNTDPILTCRVGLHSSAPHLRVAATARAVDVALDAGQLRVLVEAAALLLPNGVTVPTAELSRAALRTILAAKKASPPFVCQAPRAYAWRHFPFFTQLIFHFVLLFITLTTVHRS